VRSLGATVAPAGEPNTAAGESRSREAGRVTVVGSRPRSAPAQTDDAP
jgi:hypothetical protein